MTDRKNASLAEKSEKRRQRYEARAKLGLKPGDKRQADHKAPKKGKKTYNNATGNLRALTPTSHKAKAKSQGLTGGRPKGTTKKRAGKR